MKTTLRSLLLVTAAAVFFTSFADARHGNQAANSGNGSGSNGSVQRQTTPGQCPVATPPRDGTGKQGGARAANREAAPGKTDGQNGKGNGNVNGNGKANRNGGNPGVDPVEG
ncbi:MAG: hypothetical protein R3F07_13860 [Opitutaceae bacterium]